MKLEEASAAAAIVTFGLVALAIQVHLAKYPACHIDKLAMTEQTPVGELDLDLDGDVAALVDLEVV